MTQPLQEGLNIASQEQTVERYDSCPADKPRDFGGANVYYCPVCRVQVWDEKNLARDRDPYCVKRKQAAKK